MNRRKSLKLISSLPLLAAFPAYAQTAKSKMDEKKAKMGEKAGKMAKKAESKAKEATKKPPANLIDENDTLAKAMQYKHDATVAKLRSNKKALCSNCAKYNVCMDGDTSCKPLDAMALKTAEAAPCQIFKAKMVAGKGWCLSWQAKG